MSESRIFFFFNLGKQAALSAVVLYFFFSPANDLLGKLNHLHSEKQPLLGGGVQVSGGGNTPPTHTEPLNIDVGAPFECEVKMHVEIWGR